MREFFVAGVIASILHVFIIILIERVGCLWLWIICWICSYLQPIRWQLHGNNSFFQRSRKESCTSYGTSLPRVNFKILNTCYFFSSFSFFRRNLPWKFTTTPLMCLYMFSISNDIYIILLGPSLLSWSLWGSGFHMINIFYGVVKYFSIYSIF